MVRSCSDRRERTPVTEYVVDLSGVSSFEEFVAAFNDGFCRHCGGGWNGRSWDAFHDYLSWPSEERFRLTLRGWKQCRGLNAQERKMVSDIIADNEHVEAVFD